MTPPTNPAGDAAHADPYDTGLYDFELPPELIAQAPPAERESARLLRVDRNTASLTDHTVRDLPGLLRPGDLLVLNDTKVVRARVFGRRPDTGGRVHLFFIGFGSGEQEVLLKTRGRIEPGARIEVPGLPPPALVTLGPRTEEGTWRLTTGLETSALMAWLGQVGRTPLPPYIHRAAGGDPRDAADEARYQTVFATTPGAVAAPTAGLHFTPELLAALDAKGIARTTLTLHVGPGTFRTVSTADLREHRMHAEWFEVPAGAAEAVAAARARGGRVVAVGTTAVRSLESAADEDGTIRATSGETRIFIHPPYRFRAVGALFTNFHVPRSTLLMLVAAFAGRERTLEAYRHAIARRYRLLSYGDAMLVV